MLVMNGSISVASSSTRSEMNADSTNSETTQDTDSQAAHQIDNERVLRPESGTSNLGFETSTGDVTLEE